MVARYLVRLTVPRRGGWRSWRAVSGTFEHRLAEQGSDVVLTPRIDRELRGHGRDHVRVVVVAAVVADDVAEALDLAWWASQRPRAMTSPDGTWLPSRPKSSLQMGEPAVQKRPIVRRWPERPHGPASAFQNPSENFPETREVVRRF